MSIQVTKGNSSRK